ncbi:PLASMODESMATA CALLOSE-BINDING PROTEIN 3-like [Diospyros lotus]|uniref:PLASMODESMATA CALLOSE-BINDING PROTEIN 3-like n=1 Tax=Diospyros lotus TaxID=55363 RepID=UPI00224DA33E|nr:PLASMODESMATA CALLOSE-BINDING PROTEIN 3-like [Diospyros lotus]
MGAVLVVCLMLFLALTGRSSATYCVCKDGVSDSVLQKNIDYACGAGADCTPIHENGACYNPNTVKDHCSYAVNSYFQKKGQTTGSCDFAGTAVTSPTSPSQSSTCVYPASASAAGTPSTGTPSTGTATGQPSTTPSTGTNTGTGSGIGTSTSPSTFGMAPNGNGGITNTDSAVSQNPNLFWPLILTLLLSGLPAMALRL